MDQLNGKLTISGAITGNLGRYGVQGEHYTGPTLVIPSDADQILATNGLFVDDDITVKAIPQKELLGVVYDKTYKLSATDYATWTPSTSAGVIVASVNATTFEADMTTYDYELKWETSFIAAYKSGATMVAQVIYEGAGLIAIPILASLLGQLYANRVMSRQSVRLQRLRPLSRCNGFCFAVNRHRCVADVKNILRFRTPHIHHRFLSIWSGCLSG